MTKIEIRHDLAAYLRSRADACGIPSQRALARHLGVSMQTVSHWFNGRGRFPSAKYLALFREKLGGKELLARIEANARAVRRKRRPRFKGFIHGDGI